MKWFHRHKWRTVRKCPFGSIDFLLIQKCECGERQAVVLDGITNPPRNWEIQWAEEYMNSKQTPDEKP